MFHTKSLARTINSATVPAKPSCAPARLLQQAQSQQQHHNACCRRQLQRQQARALATSSTSKVHQFAQEQAAATGQRHNRARWLNGQPAGAQPDEGAPISDEAYKARLEHLRLWHSIETIKRLGYRAARLDPLALHQPEQLGRLAWSGRLLDELKASAATSGDIVATRGLLVTKQPLMAVGELLDSVLAIYTQQECGLELAHMSEEREVEWIRAQWERLSESAHLDRLEQLNLAKLMLECETFDHFMGAKFPTTKRYGCEGAEPMLVVLDELLRLCHLGDQELCPGAHISDLIIGMPHRGRLNLLACLLGFPPAAIFSKTRGEPELDLQRAWMAQGDVLSHLSTNCRFVYGLEHGQHLGLSRDSPEPINVSLLPNPSHLEVAAPMAMGAARGRAHNKRHAYSSSPKFPPEPRKQEAELLSLGTQADDYSGQFASSILPIQIHGDASLAGQGIIQESLQMSNLAHFTVAGSLHLVVNNQIGYTTEPAIGRSSRYCTDIFKLIEAPVFHVNGQNIDSVVRATRLALAYRQRFRKDVALNLICYRQHGHNELDEPSFTQPLMYSRIRQRASIPQSYCDQIGMPQEERRQIVDKFRARLQAEFKQSDGQFFKPDNDNYRNFELPTEFHRDHVLTWQTGVAELESLRAIALDSVRLPAGEPEFKVHPNLERVLINERRHRFRAHETEPELERIQVDWATAEILAFGSLLRQNHSVRLAGQDVARGTFSTRHAVLFDQNTQQAYVPLNEMDPPPGDLRRRQTEPAEGAQARAKLEVANTILSEEAALAYEFGYSVETCELTLWEAQFGDFFNTAQSIIDTLISSSESKWLKQSALTLLLPHGLDGAGPEHSSAHLERFLQMSSSSLDSIDTEARTNWSVCFPTTPAQYFHLLRRQVLRPFRKPLVVMAPKVIFRHPECQSELREFGEQGFFKPLLDDPKFATRGDSNPASVDTVVLCSGKIYFALSELRRAKAIDNVALVRIEELCPFPIQSIVQTLKRYPKASGQAAGGLVWFQEEHRNQGAYQFVASRLESLARLKLRYIGRRESELPASGTSELHKRELSELFKQFESLKRF